MIASRAHGFERQHNVTEVLKICGLTVMTRVREFEATASANLTLDEFGRRDIEEEADPPGKLNALEMSIFVQYRTIF